MQNCIIANFDRKEFIRPEGCGEVSSLKAVYSSYDGVLLVLAILLADGNGRGGGDFRRESPRIGSWKGGRLALLDEAVLDAQLSEPGLEDTPLHKQMTSLGKDVTSEIVALFEGANEGTLSAFVHNSTIPLRVQRSMAEKGLRMLESIATRKGAIPCLESFVGFFGFQPGFSPYWLQKRLERGLLEFAEATGQPERYTVKDLSWKKGVLVPLTPAKYQTPQNAVVELAFGLVPMGGARAKRFVLKFGKDGSLFEDSILSIFKGFKFDAPPVVAPTTSISPEAANVLNVLRQIATKGV